MRATKYIYLLLSIFIVSLSSCYKDIGNYDYKEINEVVFAGIQPSYTVMMGEHFTLKPEISFTQDKGNDTAAYKYEWVGLRKDNVLPADQRRLISPYKNIDQIITLSPGPYRVYYRVTDKETGVQWQTTFDLTVVTSVFEGWMVLNDVHGKSRLDMISLIDNQYVVKTDILTTTGSGIPEAQLGKPLFVNCYPFDPTMYGIYICTETGANKIDPETFKWDITYNIKYEFVGNLPDNFSVDFMSNRSGNTAWIHGTDNNVYYYYRVFQIKPDVPINIVKGEPAAFKASKYIAYSGSANVAVMFDEDNKRFVRHLNNESTSTLMPDGTLFDYNTNKELLYMEYSPFNNGNVFAILDSVATKKRYLARFTLGTSITQVYYDEITGTDIDKAEQFAVSPDLGYIFYNVGGKVYEYDMSLKTSKLMIDKGNHKITLLKFHNFLASKYNAERVKLIVCSYDPALPEESCGKMEFYTVPPVNGDLVFDKQYTGFGKIVSISYRER